MWSEEQLDQLLSEPSPALVEDMRRIDGDIMLLGAGGKMGPTQAILARRAVEAAGLNKRIIAVSRYSDPDVLNLLNSHRVETIAADLADAEALAGLPDVPNIIFMAGKKFGTNGNESETWFMNASLPTLIARRFRQARFVVFSTGNIFPLVSTSSGGCTDDVSPSPIGEYGMSALARERIFEYAAQEYGCKVLIYRLNYAVDLRYGVLHDLAVKIMRQEPISVQTSCFNCVWQGYANEIAIRSLLLADSPARHLNVTGPETLSVRQAALLLGQYLGCEPIFEGEESHIAFLSNAGHCFESFGYPSVSINTLIRWQAEWLLDGGRTLGKPTHFEERKGEF